MDIKDIQKAKSLLEKKPEKKPKPSLDKLILETAELDTKPVKEKRASKEDLAQIELDQMVSYDSTEFKNDEPEEAEVIKSDSEWDVPIDLPVTYFDPELSYELTGYRPITATKGLDFDPKLFTVAADTYRKNGRYTDFIPGTFKHRNHWKEEFDKCLNGVTIGKYRITGEHYFFLNYYRLLSVLGVKDGTEVRSEDFPGFFTKQYEYFHYIELARKAGYDVCVFKCRGIGFSEMIASNLAHGYTFHKATKSIVAASKQSYVDSTLAKTWQELDFLNTGTEGGFRRVRMKIDTAVRKRASKVDSDKNESGWMSEIEGVVVDNPRKLRGARVYNLCIDEAGSFPNLVETYIQARALVDILGYRIGQICLGGCVCAGTKVWTSDHQYINIENLLSSNGIMGYDGTRASYEPITYMLPELYKDCVEITTNFNKLNCSTDHPLLVAKIKNKKKRYVTFTEAGSLQVGDYIVLQGNDRFGTRHVLDAYLLGSLLGDGNYTDGVLPSLSIADPEQFKFFDNHYKLRISKSRVSDTLYYKQVFFNASIRDLLIEYGMYGQVRNTKDVPASIWSWDKESICDFLAGYFDTDGNVLIVKQKHRSIKLTCKYLHILKNVLALLLNLGIQSHIIQELKGNSQLYSNVNHTTYNMPAYTAYVLYINSADDIVAFRENIHLKIPAKQERLNSYIPGTTRCRYKELPFIKTSKKGDAYIGKVLKNVKVCKITAINPIGNLRVYNLTANTTHTYLTNGFVSHNTGGDQGPQLAGLKLIFYNPEEFQVLPYKNTYAANGLVSFTGFFIPSYEMWFGAKDNPGFDSRGVVDSERARAFYKNKWAKITDPKHLIRDRAEFCFTPEDAFVLEGSNQFDLERLTDLLAALTIHNVVEKPKHIKLHWQLNGEGTADRTKRPNVEYVTDGPVLIVEMPMLDDAGVPYTNLYIAGTDGVDLDSSTSTGLTDVSNFCMVIMRRQLGTKSPKVVAIYKDRPKHILTAFDTALQLCMFYNCKMLVEATRISIKLYFEKEHKLDFMLRRPKATANAWGKTNFKQFGVPATEPIIKHQLDLIELYIVDYCEEIQFPDLLDELIRYSYENKRKFDEVAAFGLTLLADEDYIGKLARVSGAAMKHLSFGYFKDDNGQIAITSYDENSKPRTPGEAPFKLFV